MISVCNVDADGTKWWYLNGKRHRVDGPAVEWACGTGLWYLNGQPHRVDGPAFEWASGRKEWWLNGKRHRVDGPACEWPHGIKEWYLNGQLHRVDGPAVEWVIGTREWYLNGAELTHTEFIRHIKHAFRETVIALLPLELPPYELLALLEYAFPVLATSEHHRACIQLIMGMAASRRRIK